MAITDAKVKDSDFNGKDIAGLPDKPSEAGINAATLKDQFDYGAKHIVAPHLNQLIDALTAASAASEIGATVPGIAGVNVQAILAELLRLHNAHESNLQNPHQVTKTQIGLGNVDNTSDQDKPLSAAQQQAVNLLNGRVDGLNTSLQATQQTVAQVVNQQLPKLTQDITEANRKADSAIQTASRAENTANGIADTANKAYSIALTAQQVVNDNLYGYDPVTGKRLPLYDIMVNIYNATAEYPITAAEFDALLLTAATFDAYNITAFEYDRRAKQILKGA